MNELQRIGGITPYQAWRKIKYKGMLPSVETGWGTQFRSLEHCYFCDINHLNSQLTFHKNFPTLTPPSLKHKYIILYPFYTKQTTTLFAYHVQYDTTKYPVQFSTYLIHSPQQYDSTQLQYTAKMTTFDPICNTLDGYSNP